jgi:hypothetical protein
MTVAPAGTVNTNVPPQNYGGVSPKQVEEFKEAVNHSTTLSTSEHSQDTSKSLPFVLATRPPINLGELHLVSGGLGWNIGHNPDSPKPTTTSSTSGGLGWNIGHNPDSPKPTTTSSMAVHTGTTGSHFGWDLARNRGA